MGAVYLVEHTRLGRLCAVKENIPDPNANPQVLAQRGVADDVGLRCVWLP